MRTSFALLLIGGLAVASPATQSAPKQTDQPFSITITPLSTEVRAGAQVYVKIKLSNTSKREIMGGSGFHAEGLDTSYQYGCHNAAGKSVAKEIALVGSAHDVPLLEPGESHEETAPLSRACDFSRPGQYEIQVSRSVRGDPHHHIIKSNIIKITVIE